MRYGFALIVFLAASTATADEEIIRRHDVTVINQGTLAGNHVFFTPGVNVPAETFRVYTKEEIDAKLATKDKTIADLTAVIEVLQKNLKDLADVNDALVRRLDEIENRRDE